MGQPSASQVQQMQVPAETPQGQQSNAIPQPAGEVQAIARETSPRPAERAGRAGGDQNPSQAKNAPEIEAQGESGQSASPPGETTGEREWWDVPVENPENLSLPQVERCIRKLKKARKQDIADEVERMKRTPGGQGVTISYEHEHYNPVTGRGEGQIVKRGAVSNNPQWYQDAWKRYGRKPRKSEYGDIAEDSLKKIQEFDERDEEIARLERLRKHLKEQTRQEGSRGGGEKSAQNTAKAAKAANEGGGQEKKAPTSNQDSKKTVGGGENAVTIEENIANGQLALEKIMKNHGEVKEAMERPEIGAIDFLWGQEGTDERKHKDGFGISKILLKHGAEAVNMIPEVIAKGRFEKSPNGDRVYFVLNGYRAVVRLTWDGKKKTWLVTNFLDKKIKNPDDTDAFVRSVSTADGTISPSEQDSSVDSSIPQQKTERNEKIGSFSIGKNGKKFTATLEESLGVEFAKDHAEALATLAGSYGGKEKDGRYTFPTKKGKRQTICRVNSSPPI